MAGRRVSDPRREIEAFVEDLGIATEEKVAPFFEQAGNTSEVQWRVARVRMGAPADFCVEDSEAERTLALWQKQRRGGGPKILRQVVTERGHNHVVDSVR